MTESSILDDLSSSFFIAGGTLPANTPSYVERAADSILYENLLKGEFCYVLTSRQMGKSSLMGRVAKKLRNNECSTIILDLSAIGYNLTVTQWYFSLLSRVGRQLQLEDEFDSYWELNDKLSPLERLFGALKEIAIKAVRTKVVIFIDEIDVVRSLNFKADEFFAAIRACYNLRTEEPELKKLSFCLLGVASPSDLIKDTRLTPFNIGIRIVLNDFTFDEASFLSDGLKRDKLSNNKLMERILFWTNGHPYLTQRVCQESRINLGIETPNDIDNLCENLFFSSRASERDDNLIFVKDRLVRNRVRVASVLDLYQKILSGKRIYDDEMNPDITLLTLSGVTKTVGGRLKVRNRIYQRVFDNKWIRNNMPDAEMKRQRAAYIRGIVRAAVLFGIISLTLAYSTWFAVDKGRIAAERERETRATLFAADINLAQQLLSNHNVQQANELLNLHKSEAGNQFAFWYLWRQCHGEKYTIFDNDNEVFTIAVSPDGKYIASTDMSKNIIIRDAKTRLIIKILSGHTSFVNSIAFSPDSKLLASGGIDKTIRIWTVLDGKCMHVISRKSMVLSIKFSPDGKELAASCFGGELTLYDVNKWRISKSVSVFKDNLSGIDYSRDSTKIACSSSKGKLQIYNSYDLMIIKTLSIPHESALCTAYTADGKYVGVGCLAGQVQVFDTQTWKIVDDVNIANLPVLSIAFSKKSHTLAVASQAGNITIRNYLLRKNVLNLEGHKGSILRLDFLPNSESVISCSRDSTIKIWDTIDKQTKVITLQNYGQSPNTSFFSQDGTKFAFIDTNDNVIIWDTKTGIRVKTIKMPVETLRIAAFLPNNNSKIIACALTAFYIYDYNSNKIIKTYYNNNKVIHNCLQISMDGTWLAGGSNKGKLCLYNLITNKNYSINSDNRVINCVGFSSDCLSVVAGGTNHLIERWTLQNFQRTNVLHGHRGTIESVNFTPSDKNIYTASVDHTIKFWDLNTNRVLITLENSNVSIFACFLKSDESELMVAERNGIIDITKLNH